MYSHLQRIRYTNPFPIRNPISLPGETVHGLSTEPIEVKYRTYTSPVDMHDVMQDTYYNQRLSGTNVDESVGLSIRMVSVRLDYSILTVSAVNNIKVRLLLYYDAQSSAGGDSGLLTVPTTVYSPLNISASQRYLVLMDRIHNLYSVGKPRSFIKSTFYKMVNLPVTYQSQSALPETGSLRFLHFTDQGGFFFDNYHINFVLRYEYTDS